jgi:hypothetical protein
MNSETFPQPYGSKHLQSALARYSEFENACARAETIADIKAAVEMYAVVDPDNQKSVVIDLHEGRAFNGDYPLEEVLAEIDYCTEKDFPVDQVDDVIDIKLVKNAIKRVLVREDLELESH